VPLRLSKNGSEVCLHCCEGCQNVTSSAVVLTKDNCSIVTAAAAAAAAERRMSLKVHDL